MNESLARMLCELNTKFYCDQAPSFSDTRHAAWPGWIQCLNVVESSLRSQDESVVLDVACGNLRFEEFLAKQLPGHALRVHALDSCDELVPDICAGVSVEKKGVAQGAKTLEGVAQDCETLHDIKQNRKSQSSITQDNPEQVYPASITTKYTHCDILDDLYKTSALLGLDALGRADFSVSFGFMHHIPLMQWRVQVLQEIVNATKPGGYVAVSFWRFMDDEGLANKAHETHHQALSHLGLSADDFEEGDYLLGWRNTPGAYRYCHSFTEADIDYLVDLIADNSISAQRALKAGASMVGGLTNNRPAQVVARFRADGRTGNLNEYLIFQVCEQG